MLSPIENIPDAQTLAQAIVNTLIEPFVVLDESFRVLAASRSFYETFKVSLAQTHGRLLYDLGDGQWNIPALRLLLETIVPEHTAMDGFEVEHDFPEIGRRTMLLNARKVVYDAADTHTILLAFLDVTERRMIEADKAALLAQAEELLRQKQVLLQEMQHRVANSLQIIASILLLKARGVTSSETREHLHDAHRRVMSVAAVQQHLHEAEGIDEIEVGTYLRTLCVSLASSMIGETRPIAIEVAADTGMIDSARAVSLGLIVTELLINAIKYAFPTSGAHDTVTVSYEISGPDWKLTVTDNGVGKQLDEAPPPSSGLGTAIVRALVRQLDAQLSITSPPGSGLTIAVYRATFQRRLKHA
ncbi:MAG: histidine kinase [Alphaproteobacteria bacterium]|nr:MAG: histidine kinase [Alphaproteobacteria bacterium]